MAKRIRHKTTQSIRIRLRLVVVIFASLAGLMMGTVLFLFHLFENETTLAGSDPMVIGRIEVFQNPAEVLKGTSDQLTIGINIQTKGKSQHLNLSGLLLSARGTSKPVSGIISNARLWSTGTIDYFTPTQQVGTTVADISDQNFRVATQQKLLTGNNYFWVTFDISQAAGLNSNRIDAECISVQIGTLTYEPEVSAPPGSISVLNNAPFYSTGNGDIASVDTWNSARDGSGNRLPGFNFPNATFHIQPGHMLWNNLSACIPSLIIERNGVLISNSGINGDFLEIKGGGTYIQSKEIPDQNRLANFIIRNGGNYIHRHEGLLPGKTKKFETFSNVILNNYSAATFTEQIAWGNLVIDCNSNSDINFSNSFNEIKGSLEIRSTGKEAYLFTSVSDTINIDGSMVIDGGYLAPASRGNAVVIKVKKEIILSSGGFYDVIPGKTTPGSLLLYPGSNLNLKAGEFKISGKHSKIILQDELVTWKQDAAVVSLPDITVLPGCILQLSGNRVGPVTENSTFQISTKAKLYCGTTTLYGTGTFRLEQGGTLATANREGINSDSRTGTIQTSKTYFSSAANYIFNGNTSPQMSGVFKTDPAANTMNQFAVQKDAISNVVVLQQDMRVTGKFIQQRGCINKNSFQLETGEPVAVIGAP